jgi:predicted nucleic acid-binding protein
MRVVVDANVVVAALMANGTVRDVLLNSTNLDFFAPEYVAAEVERQQPRITARSHLDPNSVEALIEDASQAIEFVPSHAYAVRSAQGKRLADRADASGDEEYVALALWLDAPVWSLDNDLRRIPQLRVLRTSEVAAL